MHQHYLGSDQTIQTADPEALETAPEEWILSSDCLHELQKNCEHMTTSLQIAASTWLSWPLINESEVTAKGSPERESQATD